MIPKENTFIRLLCFLKIVSFAVFTVLINPSTVKYNWTDRNVEAAFYAERREENKTCFFWRIFSA